VELFEFLMILISIIVGLAVAEVLTGVARLLKARDTVRIYWVHSLLQFGVFFALLQNWWESWDLRNLPEITFPTMAILLVNPIALFLISALLYPDEMEGADLEAHYYRQARPVWGLVILGTFSGSVLKPIALDFVMFQPDNLSGFLIMPLCAVLMATRDRRVHSTISLVILVSVILDTVIPKYLLSG
jgi:hypothetical protein